MQPTRIGSAGLNVVPAIAPPRALVILPKPSLGGLLTIEDWIGPIAAAAALRSANTMELARLLSRARESLRGRGQWSELWRSHADRLPFKRRKAEQLVIIGNLLGDANAHICARLPSAWHTLYCLSQLGLPAVNSLIQQGKVYPSLTLREARALVAEQRKDSARTPRPTFKQRVSQFSRFLRKTLPNLSMEERNAAQAELTRLLQHVTS